MRFRQMTLFVVIAALSGLLVSPASGEPTDGSGYVWTPSGTYQGTCTASFHGTAEFIQGNACFVSGTLTAVPGGPQFTFVVQSTDGAGCPSNMLGGTITVIDGPAVRADGNASRFEFASTNGDFCDGSYSFDYSAD